MDFVDEDLFKLAPDYNNKADASKSMTAQINIRNLLDEEEKFEDENEFEMAEEAEDL